MTASPEVARLLELTPATLRARLEAGAFLFLPFGTVEWHSDHLPLGLDTLVAGAVCEALAGRCGGVAGPATSWGINGVPFPYTARVEAAVLEPLYAAVFRQMAALGFRVQIAVAGHYSLEQSLALKRQALAAMREGDLTVLAAPLFEFATDLGYDGADHAGYWETSLQLWADLRLVSRERLENPAPLEGVIGRDPREARVEVGAALVGTAGERLLALARRLSSEPVAHARYLELLAAQVAVLERVASHRASGPRSLVPKLMTPPYLAFLRAVASGSLEEARTAVNDAWAGLLTPGGTP